MSSITVIGAGAWGTALAIHAARLDHQVTLWARHPQRIGTENPRLPGTTLPANIQVNATIAPSDATLLAVPMQHLRATLEALRPSGPLILCCKGLETSTGLLPLEVLHQVQPETEACFLTGPNFAREIAAGLPAAAVLAGTDAALRTTLLHLLAGPVFRLYGNDDTVGAQLGGAVKNVIALGAGAVTGAGLGENARAALITRGVAELGRLTTALGGKQETVAGLSGLGDIVLSCGSPTSRNFSTGFALGQGAYLSDVVHPDGPVIEGVPTASAIITRAPRLDLPIIHAVAGLLAGHLTMPEAVGRLLARPLRDE